ncbi:MAG: hypothetical protein J6W26_00205 [Bacteroidales bacterium]|nr:hypothetical protein [Bacteroidales bacterium]
MVYRLKRIAYNILYSRNSRRFRKMDLPKLTREEKRQIRQTWPGLTITPLEYVYVSLYKKINGFSPYYLAPCWYSEVRYITNPKKQLYALENKALCDVYFPDISFPEPYVRCLNGSYYDKDMNFLSRDAAIALLKQKKAFVIKPSLGTLQGQGVEKINCEKDDVEAAVKRAGNDFIAQEVIKQAPEIERLNPSSLNCFRVTTIYLNGKFDYSSMMKVGKSGAFRDNWNCAYLMGMDKQGKLAEFAYDYDLNPVDRSDVGVVFKGLEMPYFKEVVAHCEQMHKKLFANCGVIGWDVTLDSEYRVRVIETNLYNPGTNMEQIASGDFFRPFHDELLQYLKRKL